MQPNLAAAVKLSKFVNLQCDLLFGGRVSVAAIDDEHTTGYDCEPSCRILYVTAQWLLTSLFANANLLRDMRCTHLIMDEIHERTQQMDLLVSAVRTTLVQPYANFAEQCTLLKKPMPFPDNSGASESAYAPRLILMSASFLPGRFAQFLTVVPGLPPRPFQVAQPAPVFETWLPAATGIVDFQRLFDPVVAPGKAGSQQSMNSAGIRRELHALLSGADGVGGNGDLDIPDFQLPTAQNMAVRFFVMFGLVSRILFKVDLLNLCVNLSVFVNRLPRNRCASFANKLRTISTSTWTNGQKTVF